MSAACFCAEVWASAEMNLSPAASTTALIAASSVFQRSSWNVFQETQIVLPAAFAVAESANVIPTAASAAVASFLMSSSQSAPDGAMFPCTGSEALFFSSLEKKNDSRPAPCQYAFALKLGSPDARTGSTARGGNTAMTVGIRHDDLRRRKRATVIAAVRRAGQPSRTEIAATTALSHSTISAISSDLIGEGVLGEARGGDGTALKRGRPQVAISLNPGAASICALVLSLNSLTASLIDYAGNILEERTLRLPTLTMPRDALISAVVDHVAGLIAGRPLSAGPVMRIVLAIQGITDSVGRTLLWSPITA